MDVVDTEVWGWGRGNGEVSHFDSESECFCCFRPGVAVLAPEGDGEAVAGRALQLRHEGGDRQVRRLSYLVNGGRGVGSDGSKAAFYPLVPRFKDFLKDQVTITCLLKWINHNKIKTGFTISAFYSYGWE